MDRVTSKPAFVAEALALLAAPACACDALGMVWAANPAMLELAGSEVEGRPLLDLFDEDEITAAAAIAIVSPHNLAREGRWEAVLSAGTANAGMLVDVRAKPLPAASGSGATFVFGPCVRGAVDADMRGTLLRQATVLEHAPVGIVVTLPHLVKSCNPRMAAMLGYTAEELTNIDPVRVVAAPAQFQAFVEAAVRVLQSGGLFEGDLQLRHRDGTPVWCRIRAKAVDMRSREAGTVWIVEDISAVRQAMIEVQAMMTNATIGIFLTRDRVFTRYNRCFAEMFGYGETEYIGHSTRPMYMDEQDFLKAGQHAYGAVAEGRPVRCESTMVRKDGTRMWVSVIGYPAKSGELGQGTMIWMIEDRSSQKRAEESLRNALMENQAIRDALEVRVQERTAELQAEIVERRTAEARVHHMAYHDALTGLPNRALLAERLDRALLAARRDDRRLALMFLDLDRFKTINDSLGHATGDHLLREVAQRLCRVVRASDTVARLGGDEFVVLVPGVHAPGECALVGDKIIEALADPVRFEGRSLHISTSIGICLYPDDGADVESLMRKADAAMYQAKAAGRNNYQFFAERMNAVAERHFELETELRGALARDEFALLFQPIVSTSDRRPHALEVLLRWRHPQRGLVAPDEFIPILEENGMIVPVGEWVIRRACEQAVAWQRAGLRTVPLAINLSARQFMHRGLIESIRAIVDDTGIDPSLLEFEITETALMQHGGQTLETLGQIFRMGIRLSIDDFGTGYSSLAYLKRFPVRKIKIDRAFVRELETSSEDQAIVAAIMALAGSLQMAVVAEGVETEGQLDLLRGRGCEYAQGYLFARPILEREVALLLAPGV